MKKGRPWKIGTAALMLAALLPSGMGSAAAALTEVPYAMDSSNQAGWWTPLETYGTGLEYAYMAYNAPGSAESTHKVYIARRDGNGEWSNIPVMNGISVAEYSDDLGHNQPSIARDGSGRFHVFASMHVVAVILNQRIYLKKLLRALYFMPYITSGVAVAFVWMLLFQPKQGPINGFLRGIGIDHPPGWLSTTTSSMFAIDIIWIWFLMGYNMIIYLAALQEVSPELLEAAKIDGARAGQLLRKIIWPLVSPTTFLLLVTGMIMTIKTFGIIQATTQGGPGNSTTILSLYVYQNAFRYYDMGYAATISWALFIIILIITVIQWIGQKRWVHY
ncbi:carbohydrate ABC transporter permease [Paenibacillus sp. AR247]|uniref:carbohydrate ABC transporter permease n=1 Tax=Paenibacillus sp. AR247 TaxID=1631599 RepID=UPI0021574F53|nr:sugar ABC transporter permease [Paenibacillus sp. AR247]